MRTAARGVDRSLILRAVGTLGSLALLVYLLTRQGWEEILAALRGIPPTTLAVVVGLLLVSRLAVTTRWYTLLRSADPSLGFVTSLRLTLAGLFAANFLPTSVGGDVVRLAGVLQLSRNRTGSAASIVADRIVGMIGMAMLLPLGIRDLVLWLQPASLGGTLLRHRSWAPVFGAVVHPRGTLFRRGRLAATRMWDTLKMWLRRPGPLIAALGFTWIHMLCLFTEVWLLLRGLGQPISLVAVGGLWSLSYFITLVPFSINGLGLREVSITYIFSELGGITIEAALTLALILRTMDMLISLPGAAFVSGVIGDKSKAAPGDAA